jgi:hypothetical protein
VQVTRGSSGGPLYADFDGAQHIAIGMLQAFSGNGIDVSASAPSRQVLFTAATVARIAAAQADTTCDGAL